MHVKSERLHPIKLRAVQPRYEHAGTRSRLLNAQSPMITLPTKFQLFHVLKRITVSFAIGKGDESCNPFRHVFVMYRRIYHYQLMFGGGIAVTFQPWLASKRTCLNLRGQRTN